MESPGIVASGVRRSFGAVHAVRDVNLTARAGAVTGLVGPNGSGKTTVLLMLASLLAPDAAVWTPVLVETRSRAASDPDGHHGTHTDGVLLLQRR